MSFKAELVIKPEGHGFWATDGVVLATREEATHYREELLSRWMAPYDFRVIESTEPVNYRWDSTQYKAVPIN